MEECVLADNFVILGLNGLKNGDGVAGRVTKLLDLSIEESIEIAQYCSADWHSIRLAEVRLCTIAGGSYGFSYRIVADFS